MDHNLLLEPLLTWRDPERRRGKTTLPGLLARLARGELGDFPRLRAHQFHPWCMFLTQLAAIALHRAGGSAPPVSEDDWRALLLALTGGRHEPWSLVVDDLAQAAFFQPPIPERSLNSRWKTCESPDDLDVLATAKNHEVKRTLIHFEDVEAWVYALTTLQTMHGFYGQRNYGISRMNKGYGTRPRVGYAPSLSPAQHFLRDLRILLASWGDLLDRGYTDGGVALVWTEPWAGDTSLAAHELSPHFIEACRRVRCCAADSGIVCRHQGSSIRRCLSEIETGDTGDPWIPVNRTKGTALTVTGAGFNYRLLVRLLFQNEYAPGSALVLSDADADPVLLVAWALARGEGGTDGLHERSLVLAGRARQRFWKPDTRSALGTRAESRVLRAHTMGSNVLYPSLITLLHNAKARAEPSKATKEAARRAVAALDRLVDDMFFDHLFATLDHSDDEARVAFDTELEEIAWTELQRAIELCSLPDARRYKAISEAEGMFRGCLRRQFPDLVTAQANDEGASS